MHIYIQIREAKFLKLIDVNKLFSECKKIVFLKTYRP